MNYPERLPDSRLINHPITKADIGLLELQLGDADRKVERQRRQDEANGVDPEVIGEFAARLAQLSTPTPEKDDTSHKAV